MRPLTIKIVTSGLISMTFRRRQNHSLRGYNRRGRGRNFKRLFWTVRSKPCCFILFIWCDKQYGENASKNYLNLCLFLYISRSPRFLEPIVVGFRSLEVILFLHSTSSIRHQGSLRGRRHCVPAILSSLRVWNNRGNPKSLRGLSYFFPAQVQSREPQAMGCL